MRRIRALLSLCLVIVLASSGIAFAHHASIGTGMGEAGPVNTISASVLPKGNSGLDVFAEYQKFNLFSNSKLVGLAAKGEEDIHNVESLFSPSIGIAHGVSDNLTLHLRLPYVSKNNISDVHQHEKGEEPEIHQLGDAKGIGDITIFGHYRFFNSRDLQSSLLAGVKLPSGKTSDKDQTGDVLEAEFQPGSGSWDTTIGVAVTKPFGAYSVDSNILYTIVTEGTQKTDLGDVFNYNISISRPVLIQKLKLGLILEANGIWRDKQKIGGEKDKNSGGNTILLSPGLKGAITRKLMMFFSIGIPVIQDLNGEQNEMDYRTILGINLLL